MSYYIDKCPLCRIAVEATNWKLQEGLLRECKVCGQLLSSCTETQYNESMEEFNCEIGTMPEGKNKDRAFVRHKAILKEINSSIALNNLKQYKLLDVGCSSGAFLNSATKLGYEVTGVEPAPIAANAARKQGFTVYTGFLEDINFSKKFHIITLLEVIEHIKEPLSLLEDCFNNLAAGGVLAINTGNTKSWTFFKQKQNWEYLSLQNHGGHISFFNPRSIIMLAKKVGFEEITIKSRGVKLLKKQQKINFSLSNKLLKLLGEILYWPSRLLNKGHDMLVLLRKP